MKTTTLLLSVLLLTGVVLAVAPAVEARSVCSDAVDDDCRALVCVKNACSRDLNPVCVTEPCPQPIP